MGDKMLTPEEMAERLAVTPNTVRGWLRDDPAFAEEILADLIEQGYSGEKLLSEFKEINRKIRPAVEKLIEQADQIAMESSLDYVDPTDEIFGNEKTTKRPN